MKNLEGKSVPLSSLLHISERDYAPVRPSGPRLGSGLYQALLEVGQLKAEKHFGFLSSEDLAILLNLRGKGQPQKEALKQIDTFLAGAAKRAVIDLKRWLGLNPGRRGRPRDVSKRDVWSVGAALRKEDPHKWSWSKVTRKLDPKGYAEDPLRATDRMRQGIETIERESGGAIERLYRLGPKTISVTVSSKRRHIVPGGKRS